MASTNRSGERLTFHGGLQSVDRIDFGDDHTSTEVSQGSSAALANITIAGDDGDFAGDHDVRSALDTVDERFSATVEIVELRLGHGVVHVDGGHLEFALLEHLVQGMNTRGGLFADTQDASGKLGVFVVNDASQITAIIQNHVQRFIIVTKMNRLQERDVFIGKRDVSSYLFDTPDVFFIGFTFPGVDWSAGLGDGRSGVILRGEDIAATPLHLDAEREKNKQVRHTDDNNNNNVLTSAPRAVNVSMSTAVCTVM